MLLLLVYARAFTQLGCHQYPGLCAAECLHHETKWSGLPGQESYVPCSRPSPLHHGFIDDDKRTRVPRQGPLLIAGLEQWLHRIEAIREEVLRDCIGCKRRLDC